MNSEYHCYRQLYALKTINTSIKPSIEFNSSDTVSNNLSSYEKYEKFTNNKTSSDTLSNFDDNTTTDDNNSIKSSINNLDHRVIDYLIDFDANMLSSEFENDWNGIISRAISMNVKVLVVPGTHLDDSMQLITGCLQARTSVVGCQFIVTCGVHPYNAAKDSIEAVSTRLNEMLMNDSCLGVGECGLDYSIGKGFPSIDIQLDCFRCQLDLAIRHQKPLFLHTRCARSDFLDCLIKAGFSFDNPPPVKAAVHCFTGNEDELDELLAIGIAYIGLTGTILSLDKEVLRRQLHRITLSRLVIETDAPYLGFKGCRSNEIHNRKQRWPNVPSAVSLVASYVSEVTGWSLPTVIHHTSSNVLTFFGIEETIESQSNIIAR
eukprot:gene10728-14410_t